MGKECVGEGGTLTFVIICLLSAVGMVTIRSIVRSDATAVCYVFAHSFICVKPAVVIMKSFCAAQRSTAAGELLEIE